MAGWRMPNIGPMILAAMSLAATGCANRISQVESAGTPAHPQHLEDFLEVPVGFVVIGDTGVLPPEGNLAATSSAMTQYCSKEANCAFALMTGDNIYPDGATADPEIDDPVFDALFVGPFSEFAAKNPGSPIVVALGNHDWYNSREGALAQVGFHERTRPFFMDGLFFSKRLSDAFGGIEAFIIDTEMLLAPELLDDNDKDENGHMVPTGKTDRGGTQNALPVTSAEKAQLVWLENALKSSSARWKFIVAHHPLWQGRPDSKFAQSIRLREMLLPLACRYADGYFAGHQHTIEVHEDDCSTVAASDGQSYLPLPVVVSGAGAKKRDVDPRFYQWQSRLYPQNTVRVSYGESAGFVHITISDDGLAVVPVGLDESGAPVPGSKIIYAQRDDN